MTDPQPDQPSHAPAMPARLAAAIGLVVAGLAGLIIAWVLGDDFALPDPGPGWVRTATVVLMLLVLVRVWLALSDRDRRTILTVTLVTAAVAVGVTVLSLFGFADQYRRGFPGEATILAAIGGLAVAIGAVLSLRTGPARRWRIRRPAALSAVGALLLVPAVAAPLMLTAPDWPVIATTADPTTAAPIPESVSQVAWSTPIDGPIDDLVAAGAGVIVLLDDGVVALDGVTGHIRWSRHRPGAEARRIMASPDGGTILVLTGTEDRPPDRLEAIDAFTGRVRFTRDSASLDPIFASSIPITATTYISANDESELSGISLIDGSRQWTFRAPGGCQILHELANVKAVATGLLLPLMCGRQEPDGNFTEFRYLAVDGGTGQQRWQRTVPLNAPMHKSDVLTELSTDRRHLEVIVLTPPPTRTFAQFILDTETGADVPASPPLDLKTAGIAVTEGQNRQLIDLNSGAPIPAARDVLTCAVGSRPSDTVLRSGVVCLGPLPESFQPGEGRAELAAGRFGGTAATHPIPVQLLNGAPAERGKGLLDGVALVAAPGAVVVATGLAAADGRKVNVVGLR